MPVRSSPSAILPPGLGSSASHIPPRWPGGKASASRTTDLGSNPAFAVQFCPVEFGTPVANLPDAGVLESELGLVGLVSVYFDWVK